MKNYAVSDIHGCLKTFKNLIRKIKLTKNDNLYILGDLIDRGPDSKGVIDYIWELQEANYRINCIKGNHDQMMLDARRSLESQRKWLFNGGATTIESFNVNSLNEIPSQYFQFIEELPYYYEIDNYILVHAGFSFDMPNPFDELYSMLWKREWYERINFHWLKNRIIIHGHTPITLEKVKSMVRNINKNQYLNIDTGCVHKGKMKGLGVLTCLDLNKQTLILHKNIDF